MALNPATTIKLTAASADKAPFYWPSDPKTDEEKAKIPWFVVSPSVHHVNDFDYQCMQALIAEGIGEADCPTPSEWASFTIAGSVIATLTGKYITPPDSVELAVTRTDLEKVVWGELWQAIEAYPAVLDRSFLAAMLRNLFPKEHYSPPSRSSRASSFRDRWRGGFARDYPDDSTTSICNVKARYLREGHKAFAELPEPVQDSIRQVACHVPTMLEIAIARIRRTYRW